MLYHDYFLSDKDSTIGFLVALHAGMKVEMKLITKQHNSTIRNACTDMMFQTGSAKLSE